MYGFVTEFYEQIHSPTGLFKRIASFLFLRWVSSGHFPLSNLYESLLFLSWFLTNILIFLNLNLNSKKNLVITNETKLNSKQTLFDSIYGSILTPLILLLNTFASFSLPNELKASIALVPALQSNWLLMHVTMMILSYAALLCGCLFSITYLTLTFFIIPFSEKKIQFQTQFDKPSVLVKKDLNSLLIKSLDIQSKKTKLLINPNFFELINILDNLSYRILGLGFPLLTIGILSGSVWANQTWGSYWNWDPKETWSLITWFIFAIYFHTRLSKGWKGSKSAFLASFGFIIIWICYLGVNLLGTGLHSYGFFN